MAYQPIEELLPKTDFSIYKLVRLASKRATELAEGRKALVETPLNTKTTTIALEEIRRGMVVLKDVASQFQPEEIPEGPKAQEDKPEEEVSVT